MHIHFCIYRLNCGLDTQWKFLKDWTDHGPPDVLCDDNNKRKLTEVSVVSEPRLPSRVLLPLPAAQNYNLRKKQYNRQLPYSISPLTDCNFITKMLYHDAHWLLSLLFILLLLYSCGPTVVIKRIRYVITLTTQLNSTVRRRSRRTFLTHFEIFRRRFDGVVIYFFNSDFKFFDDA